MTSEDEFNMGILSWSGLYMDAFAAAICNGLAIKKNFYE